MIIQTTTDQIDLICNVSMILQKTPYTYTDKLVFFITGNGKIVIDFELNEMQFVNWDYNNEKIELQLYGVCHLYQLLPQDYSE